MRDNVASKPAGEANKVIKTRSNKTKNTNKKTNSTGLKVVLVYSYFPIVSLNYMYYYYFIIIIIVSPAVIIQINNYHGHKIKYQ